MKINRKSLGIAVAIGALVFAPMAARATTVLIDGSFVGGGTVTGSISYGAGTVFDLKTTGGPFPFEYTSANSGIEQFTGSTFDVFEAVGFHNIPSEISELHLVFLGDFFSVPNGGNVQLQSSSYECFNSFVCPNGEPSLPGFAIQNGVPEPAGWALLMIGLGLVGGGLRFARRSERLTAAFSGQ
jgi:hypothetical protein